MQPTQVQIDLVRVERLATSRKYMHAQVVGRTIMIDIATNPDLDDPRENSAKGVAPDSWEAATAAAAVCRRAQIELMKRGLDFYDFLNREIDRRGGRGKVKGRKHNGIAVLAAEVLGLPLSQDRFLPKQGWTERQLKNFRAERRKIEEHTQIDKDTGKPKYVFFKTKRSASYAGLKGAEAGNPFLTPAERWSYELDKATIRGRILGDWKISQRIYKNSPRQIGRAHV